MSSASPSNAHLRLVKKLPGQPPAGAMLPSPAPGAPAKFMAHETPPELKVQRPAMAGAFAGARGGDDTPAGVVRVARSPLQPAAAIARSARRMAPRGAGREGAGPF